jgi:FkbM family methyltransferase
MLWLCVIVAALASCSKSSPLAVEGVKEEAFARLVWNPESSRAVLLHNGTDIKLLASRNIPVPSFLLALPLVQLDYYNGGAFQMLGFMSPFSTACALEALKRAPKDSLVLDIGANIGYFASLSASMGFQSFAFEPQPAVGVLMQISALVNGWLDRTPGIVPVRAIVSDDSAKKLYIEKRKDFYGIARTTDAPSGDSEFEETIVTSLDDLFAPTAKIALLKIDVEGHDAFVLRGAQKLLESCNVEAILLELTQENLQGIVAFLTTIVPRCNYKTEYYHEEYFVEEKFHFSAERLRQESKLSINVGQNTESVYIHK